MICYFCVRGKGQKRFSVIHKVFCFFRHMNRCGKAMGFRWNVVGIYVEGIDENLTFVVVLLETKIE
jgi:hypothetical protein